MRIHDYLIDRSVDFSPFDERVCRFIERTAPWLAGDDAYRVRLGLHELLMNIRRHAYGDAGGPISVSMTASDGGVTILVTDWGRRLPDLPRGGNARTSEDGGYGLGIIRAAFDEVGYERGAGRNEWVLAVHAEDPKRL